MNIKKIITRGPSLWDIVELAAQEEISKRQPVRSSEETLKQGICREFVEHDWKFSGSFRSRDPMGKCQRNQGCLVSRNLLKIQREMKCRHLRRD